MKNIILFIRQYFNLLTFLVLQIVCIVLLSKSSKTHQAFFAAKANEVTGRINTQYNNVNGYFGLRETNKQLAEENAKLRQLLADNFVTINNDKIVFIDSTFKDTLNRVRKFTYLPASVVKNDFSLQNNYITVERGSKQGIEKDMSVVGPLGVVGKVVNVSDNYCIVMSLLNRNSVVVSAIKGTNYAGRVEWDGKNPDYLTMTNLSKTASIKKGDTLLTGNYSANYPPNLMIGTVADFKNDKTTGSYIVKIKTATNFFNLQYVNIIANNFFVQQTNLEQQKLPYSINNE